MSDLLVFRNAPRMRFRSVTVPLLEDKASFRHETIQHPIQYRDLRRVDSLGLHNWVLNVQIPFLRGISQGSYGQLYPDVFNRFVAACRDRSPGQLIDPVLGDVRVKCVSFSVTATPSKADGVIVDVEFLQAPEDIEPDDDGTPKNTAEMADSADQLDQELEIVDWEQEVPPEPTVNPLAAINSIGRQIERQGDKIGAALHDYAFRMEQIEETANRLENPQKSEVIRAVRRNRDSATQLAKRVREPQKTIVRVTANTRASIQSVALDVNMTVEAFIRLNPSLAKIGFVEQGQEYRKLKEAIGA